MDRVLSGREDRGRPTLCLVSTTSHRAVAGLSAYARGLARAAQDAWRVESVSRFELDGRAGLDPTAGEPARRLEDDLGPLTIVAPRPGSAPALRTVRPLIHRRATQPLSLRAFSAGYRAPLAVALPEREAIVHFTGSGWELLGFPAAAIARRRGLPFTILPAMHPHEWGDSTLDARLYREADGVFALSRHERDRLIELGVAPERIHITPLAAAIPPGGDGAGFRDRYGLRDRPIVLFTGRKERYKGYHALLVAMEAVRRSHPGTALVAAGAAGEDAPGTPDVDLGQCDEATKADALAACDVFCMPSDGESFGIVYTEAWAYGKPVVGGPAPAARELIADAGGGLTVERQEPAEVAAALGRLLGDAELRASFGQAGRKAAQDRYSWDAVWRVHSDAWTMLRGTEAGAKASGRPSRNSPYARVSS